MFKTNITMQIDMFSRKKEESVPRMSVSMEMYNLRKGTYLKMYEHQGRPTGGGNGHKSPPEHFRSKCSSFNRIGSRVALYQLITLPYSKVAGLIFRCVNSFERKFAPPLAKFGWTPLMSTR